MASGTSAVADKHESTAVYEAASRVYSSLPAKGFPACGVDAPSSDGVLEWTMMAAIIVSGSMSTADGAAERPLSFEPVVISTGTRCLGMDAEAYDGASVRDMHAEVLAVRAFHLALSREMLSHRASCRNGPICALPVALLCHDAAVSHFSLRPHLRLHLYISDSPCGSASEYADSDEPPSPHVASNGDTEPARRTGAKRLRGDAADGSGRPALRVKSHRSDLPPGKHTRSMCCSDKMCRWMALGVQGRALAAVMDPLYLSSITLSHEETGNDAFWAAYALSNADDSHGLCSWPAMTIAAAGSAVDALDDHLSVSAPRLRPQARAAVQVMHGRVCDALGHVDGLRDVLLPALHVISRRFDGGRSNRFQRMFDTLRKRPRVEDAAAAAVSVHHPRPHACALTCVWMPPAPGEPCFARDMKLYTHAKGHASVEVLTGAKGCVQGGTAGSRIPRVSKANLAALAEMVLAPQVAGTYADLKAAAPVVYESARTAFFAPDGPFAAWNHADPRVDSFPVMPAVPLPVATAAAVDVVVAP